MYISSNAAEQCQKFCPSSVKHGLLQPQHLAPFHRRRPKKTLGEGARRRKERSEFGRPLSRTSARQKALKMQCERKASTEKASSGEVSLSTRRFQVSCCSDIYTSFGGSAELNSHPESDYIYAESIKGCDTSSSSVSQGWDSLCLYAEIEKTCDVVHGPRLQSTEIGSSTVALFGSDTSSDGASIGGDCDSESCCVNAKWEQSFDSNNESAEAQWGSASSCPGSSASGYITDYDFKYSFSTPGRHDRSEFGSYFEAGHGVASKGHFDTELSDSSEGQFETRHCASLVNHFEGGFDVTTDVCLAGENWDLSIGHFDTVGHFHAKGCDSGHFKEGRHNSPIKHFETRCHELSVGDVEAELCDSPVDRVGPGHYDSLHGRINEASCDLYNAVPESGDAVCYCEEKRKYLFYFEDSSELLTWRKLQGVVTHPDRFHVAPFFHEMTKDSEHDRNQEKGMINKGFLFHPQRVQTCISFIA